MIIGEPKGRIARLVNRNNLDKFVSRFLIFSLTILVLLASLFLLFMFIFSVFISSFYEILSENIFILVGIFLFLFISLNFPFYRNSFASIDYSDVFLFHDGVLYVLEPSSMSNSYYVVEEFSFSSLNDLKVVEDVIYFDFGDEEVFINDLDVLDDVFDYIYAI